MAENQEKSFFDGLKKFFNASITIKGKHNAKVKVLDLNKIQTSHNLETNRAIDKFKGLQKASGQSDFFGIPNINGFYQLRSELYRDYECIDGDTLIPLYTSDTFIIEYNTIKELSKLYPNKDTKFNVFSFDIETNEYKCGIAHSVRKTKTEITYKITFDNKRYIIATANHPFLLENKTYKIVNDLKVNDRLIGFPSGIITIDSITEFEVRDVYDMTVEKYHNFATDNCFAHNCMDLDSLISSALDLYSEETCTENELGDILTVISDKEEIQESLQNLFYDILNINFNLSCWTRNLVKYGDFFIKLDIVQKIGITNALPMSPYSIEREENPIDTQQVRFKYDGSIGPYITTVGRNTSNGNLNYLQDFEVAHFRILSDSNYLPYGRCLTADNYVELENTSKRIDKIVEGDKVWSFNIKTGEYELTKVLKTINSGVKEIIQINTSYKEIKCSYNHPILIYNHNTSKFEYKNAEDLKNKDSIVIGLDRNTILENIVSINKVKSEETFDIYVESENHNFIANGIIVHNSMLEGVRKTWKQLQMLEDSMLLYRISRAPMRFVYKIDVGNIPPQEVDQYIEEIKKSVKKTPYIDENTGNLNLKYNAQPVAYYTNIPLVDGRTITIQELAKEYDSNKKNYVYSIDRENNNEIAIGEVSWCGLTKKDADIVRIWLDDNSYIDFEPSHPVMLRNGEYKKAKDLQENESLMPFYTQNKSLRNELVFNPKTLIYKYTTLKLESENVSLDLIKIVSKKQFLTEKLDVYCMTVEKYHNFAIDSHGGNIREGIFVKNTSLEDFFLPVRGGQSGTSIETIGGMEYSAIEDIDYIKNKVLAGLRIPKAFLGFDEAIGGDKSNLSTEDVRFSRTIHKIQKMIVSELTKIAIIHLYTQGFKDDDIVNFELKLSNPSKAAEIEKIELLNQKIGAARDLKELKMLSNEWIYKNVFGLQDDEFEDEMKNIIENQKTVWRLAQIEQEGKDPREKTFPDDSEKEESNEESGDEEEPSEDKEVEEEQVEPEIKDDSETEKYEPKIDINKNIANLKRKKELNRKKKKIKSFDFSKISINKLLNDKF